MTVRVGVLCWGELTLGNDLFLRARDYNPQTGTFLQRDPMEGVDGTPDVANPYSYVHNSPVNGTDPSGKKCTDKSCFPAIDAKDSQAHLSLSGLEDFKGLGRIEVAGFIKDAESSFGWFLGTDWLGEIGLYKGDDRHEIHAHPIPLDKSRFYPVFDFGKGEGFINVEHTCSVDPKAGCWSAWPVEFNGVDVPNTTHQVLDTRNKFSLGRIGNRLELFWSLVMGDRRVFSGRIPTEALLRPPFEGRFTMELQNDKSVFDYRGDCFPSRQAFQNGNFIFGELNAPASSTHWAPLSRGCDAHAALQR